MRILRLLSAVSIGIYGASSATSQADTKPPAPLCVVLASNNSLAASFSLKNPTRETWSWNTLPNSSSDGRPEYAWIVEPGLLHHGRFKHDQFAFGVSYRNVLPQSPTEHGSFEKLLPRIKYGSVYLNSSENNQRKRADERLQSFVVRAFRDHDEIFVVIQDTHAIKTILARHPTHARLTSILPYPDESYSCIAEITYESSVGKQGHGMAFPTAKNQPNPTTPSHQ